MKKKLLVASIAAVVLLAGVLVVKAAAKTRSFRVNNGTVVQKFVNTRDKTILVSYGGKTYNVYLKNFKNNKWKAKVRKCTRSNFSRCRWMYPGNIKLGDKIKIRGVYNKPSKRYVANQVWIYTPPSSGY